MKRGMNKILILLACFVFLIGLSGSVGAQASCPSGMVSYWGLNDGSGATATDSVDANDGTLINDPQWTTGIVDGALSFDGIEDYVEVGHSDNLNPGTSFTVEAWIKLRSVNSWQAIVTKHHENLIHGWTLAVTDDTQIEWNPNSLIDNQRTHQPLYGTTVLQRDTWYHVVGLLDGTSQQIYINGTLDAERTYTGTPLTNNLPLKIGSTDYRVWFETPNYDKLIWFFDGVIDEVAIYNRALTAEEIQQHYQSGLAEKAYCSPPPTLEERVAALEEEVGELQDELAEKDEAIDDLNAMVEGLKSTINKIIEKINWLIDYVIPEGLIKQAEKKGHPEPYPELGSEGS